MAASATRKKPAEKMPSAHPSWSDMITECITTIPDGARHGVSRLAIKKFVDSKYHLFMDAAATSELNRAITYGTEIGNFVLSKGPSGKVKLAPKRASEVAKGNKKPKWNKETREVPVTTRTRIPSSFAEERPSKTIRKYTSMAKKARVTPFPGRQVPPRKANTKRLSVPSHDVVRA